MALYKRPGSKFYWYKFTFDGSLVQQSSKCTNKADAKKVESAHLTQLALGKIGISPKKDAPTFENAVKDFLGWAKMNRADVTLQRIAYSFQPLIDFFGKTKLDKIEAADVEKYILDRSRQTSRKTKELITRETINRELCGLKMLYRRLVDNETILKNPVRLIKQLPENERKFHVITPDEEKRYLLACPPILQDVAALMLETGMRCGEVYRIKKDELFLDDDYLKITKGKTASSVRRVYLSEKAKDILAARMRKFDGQNLFPHNDTDGNEATGSLIHIHLKTVRKLGFNFRIYDCRHTFATRAVESGMNLTVLAFILGHSSLKMLMRYSHPSEAFKADAIKRMGKMKIKRKAKAV